MMETFFMVYVEGGNTPAKRHSTKEEAMAEGERLLKQIGKGHAWVLLTVAEGYPRLNPIVWEEAE